MKGGGKNEILCRMSHGYFRCASCFAHHQRPRGRGRCQVIFDYAAYSGCCEYLSSFRLLHQRKDRAFRVAADVDFMSITFIYLLFLCHARDRIWRSGFSLCRIGAFRSGSGCCHLLYNSLDIFSGAKTLKISPCQNPPHRRNGIACFSSEKYFFNFSHITGTVQKTSSIVPFCSHVDHTGGYARKERERSREIISKCALSAYSGALEDYRRRAELERA